MKIKHLITAAAIAIGVAGVQEVQAQKVYKEGTAVVIDFGPGTGFPQGAVETVKDKKVITPSNELGANNDHNGSINQTVYKKIEVQASNASSGGTYWATAYKLCTDKNMGGVTGWRLPTQRELMYIWIFRTVLVDLGIAAFDSNGYWSATEYGSGSCWNIYFNTGLTSVDIKSYNYARARCVREL